MHRAKVDSCARTDIAALDRWHRTAQGFMVLTFSRLRTDSTPDITIRSRFKLHFASGGAKVIRLAPEFTPERCFCLIDRHSADRIFPHDVVLLMTILNRSPDRLTSSASASP